MTRSSEPHVSIIVLNWNGLADTLRCLDSLRKIAYPSYNVLVVDNHSDRDELSEIRRRFPEVQSIQNNENLGYAGGNNVALRHILEDARATYAVVLNNDTVVDPLFLERIIATMETDPRIAVAGPVLYDLEDGKPTDRVQTAGGFVNPLTGNVHHHWTGWQEEQIPRKVIDVAYLPGACLCLRVDAMSRSHLFDERYHLYFEDTDLCYRLRGEGKRIVLISTSRVWHRVVRDQWTIQKRYFVMRNRLWFLRRYATKIHFVMAVFYWGLKSIAQSAALLLHGQLRECAALLRGYVDGLRGMSTGANERTRE